MSASKASASPQHDRRGLSGCRNSWNQRRIWGGELPHWPLSRAGSGANRASDNAILKIIAASASCKQDPGRVSRYFDLEPTESQTRFDYGMQRCDSKARMGSAFTNQCTRERI